MRFFHFPDSPDHCEKTINEMSAQPCLIDIIPTGVTQSVFCPLIFEQQPFVILLQGT